MKTWYFTFCGDQPLSGYCQPIRASSWGAARAKMCEMYGEKWGFQYSEDEWLNMKNDPKRWYPLERELELVVVEDSENG